MRDQWIPVNLIDEVLDNLKESFFTRERDDLRSLLSPRVEFPPKNSLSSL